MKPRLSNQRNQAWTMVEVLVVIATLIVLAVVLLPWLAPVKRRSARDYCLSNVHEINLAFRIWEGDNNNKFPMSVSVNNGGAMELIATGNVAGCVQVMSNELSTPKILICPFDNDHRPATSFETNFSNANVSYFINPDADQAWPQEIMIGDDNLAIDDVPVKSGLVALPSSSQVSWTADRHHYTGNLGYADGSVDVVSITGLHSALDLSTNGTPSMTNRFVIP